MAWLASALFTAHELHCEYSHWNTCLCAANKPLLTASSVFLIEIRESSAECDVVGRSAEGEHR